MTFVREDYGKPWLNFVDKDSLSRRKKSREDDEGVSSNATSAAIDSSKLVDWLFQYLVISEKVKRCFCWKGWVGFLLRAIE